MPCPAPWPRRRGRETRTRQNLLRDRLRRVSSILRFETGSCAGFSSANAVLNDHSFGIAELIEVKLRPFCESWGKHRAGCSTTGRAYRHGGPNPGSQMLLFDCAQPLRKLQRYLEFRRHALFQKV